MNILSTIFLIISLSACNYINAMESETNAEAVVQKINDRGSNSFIQFKKRKMQGDTSKSKRSSAAMQHMKNIMSPEVNPDVLITHLSNGEFNTPQARELLTSIGMGYYKEYLHAYDEVEELNNTFAKLRLVVINSCYSTELDPSLCEDGPLGKVFICAYNELKDIKQHCAPFIYGDAKDLSLAQLLLEIAKHPSPINEEEKKARNALVQYILRLGVDRTVTDGTGSHALLCAAQRGDKALYDLLKDHPKSAKMTDSVGRTAEKIIEGVGSTHLTNRFFEESECAVSSADAALILNINGVI